MESSRFSFELVFLSDVLGFGIVWDLCSCKGCLLPCTDPHISVSWMLSACANQANSRDQDGTHSSFDNPGWLCCDLAGLCPLHQHWPCPGDSIPHTKIPCPCPGSPCLKIREHLGAPDCQWEGEPRMKHRGLAL